LSAFRLTAAPATQNLPEQREIDDALSRTDSGKVHRVIRRARFA
jgi:hypothetical protein